MKISGEARTTGRSWELHQKIASVMRTVLVVLMFVLVAAGISCISGAELDIEGGKVVQLSSFVRRNLVQNSKVVQFFPAQNSRSNSHYMAKQSHPRRLADVDCASTCPGGLTCCNMMCLDVKTDANNCGLCRYKCGFNLQCCSGKCVNLQTNPSHCGNCGTICPKGSCSMGLCGYSG